MENKQSYDVPGHHSPSLSYLGSHDSENEIDLSSTIGFKSSSQAPGVYRTRTLTYPEGDINSIQLEESVMTDLKDFTMEKREKDKKRKRKSSRRKSSSQKSQRSRRKPKAKPKKKGRQSSPTTKSISKSTDPSDASPTTTAPLKQKIPKGFDRYQEYLNVSILFFEAQRSGSLPPNQRVQWRKSAHLEDGKKYDWDLSGGYYDAGDFIKFGLPGSYSMTMLSWSLIEYPTGFAKAKQLEYILEAIKWGLDYILKCHVERAKFVVQVGDPKSDHDYWGSPEDMPSSVDRPVYFVTPELPGTEPVLEAASALASGSIIFKKYGQSAYAAKLLEHAIQLYELGSNHRGKYQGSVDKQKKGMSLGVNEGYLSSSYDDELVWSNLWLYQATNDTKYLSRAKTSYAKFSLDRRIIGTFHSWDDKSVGSVLLLSLLTDDKQYSKAMDKYFAKVMKKKTPGGLLWLPESSSGSANVAMSTTLMALIHADRSHRKNASALIEMANSQVEYLLGQNPLKRSYIIGSGQNFPLHPHHAASHGVPNGLGWKLYSSRKPNQHILHGGLVGGPRKDDSHRDGRQRHVENEPALDFNAVLVGVFARMAAKF